MKSSPPTNQHTAFFLQAGCPSCHTAIRVRALTLITNQYNREELYASGHPQISTIFFLLCIHKFTPKSTQSCTVSNTHRKCQRISQFAFISQANNLIGYTYCLPTWIRTLPSLPSSFPSSPWTHCRWPVVVSPLSCLQLSLLSVNTITQQSVNCDDLLCIPFPQVTGQLVDKPTRRQTNSPTIQFAEIDLWTFRHVDMSFRLLDVAAPRWLFRPKPKAAFRLASFWRKIKMLYCRPVLDQPIT